MQRLNKASLTAKLAHLERTVQKYTRVKSMTVMTPYMDRLSLARNDVVAAIHGVIDVLKLDDCDVILIEEDIVGARFRTAARRLARFARQKAQTIENQHDDRNRAQR